MKTTFYKPFQYIKLIFIAVCLLSGCENSSLNEQAEADGPIKIGLETAYQTEKSISLSEIASEIKYIPLETRENNAVGRVFRLMASPDEFVIWHENKVSVFDTEGKQLSIISAEGKGPGEYIGINDVAVDFEQKELFVLDNKKILIYSFEGKYLRSFPLNFWINNMGLMPDKGIAGYISERANMDSLQSCRLVVLGADGKLAKQFCKGKPYTGRLLYGFVSSFYHFDDQLFHKDPFEEMIYQVVQDSLIPHIDMGLGKMLFPIEILRSSADFNQNRQNYFQFSDIFETESFLLFDYYCQNEKGYFLYDKQSKQFWNRLSKDGVSPIENNFDGVPFWPRAVHENTMFNLIEAFEFKEWIENNQAGSALKGLANGLKDTDNPVIQMVNLK